MENLRLIDSMNFLLGTLDSLEKGSDLKSFTITQENVLRQRKAAISLEEKDLPVG